MSAEHPIILTSSANAIDAIGAEVIMARLGVSRSSVKEARRGLFPANWFNEIDALARERGHVAARECFRWRGSDVAE